MRFRTPERRMGVDWNLLDSGLPFAAAWFMSISMIRYTEINKIAFVGNYQPRLCGIATFTTDVCRSVAAQYPSIQCLALPVNDYAEGYAYPPEVRFEIEEQELPSYQRAADFLNISNVDAVSIQHEFGIYGGVSGSYLLALMRNLKMPVVTTLHTVLQTPNDDQRRVMSELLRLSTRMVVMSRKGVEILKEVYRVPEAKVDLIPHGIPDVPFVDPNYYKDEFEVEGKNVLLTFGLLSQNKGIEHVLNALPAIVAEFPNTVYIVLGATHPKVLREQGDSYRLSLERLAKKNGVQKNVIFYNRFVDMDELKEFIGAADIYITPYLHEAQIVSGTLAYTFGAGKAVVSTPYWYAQELLAGDCGVLVPFRDPAAIAREVSGLLRDETRRHALRKNAYKQGRNMVWSNVAQLYVDSFRLARMERGVQTRKSFIVKTLDQQDAELPRIKLDHVLQLTDGTGLFQHALFSIPHYSHGYCVDDNARALILMVLLEELGYNPGVLREPTSAYAAFLVHAFSFQSRRFRNFMNYDRRWAEEVGSEDSHGRSLWALGVCVGRSHSCEIRDFASLLFEQALPPVAEFSSPRAWAFALLGLQEYLKRLHGDRLVTQLRDTLAVRLFDLFKAQAREDWPWLEQELTYANARLPHALMASGRLAGQEEWVQQGLASLQWLCGIQTAEGGYFRPVSSAGWKKGQDNRPLYDQQPIEAYTTVAACLEAYRITHDTLWYDRARQAFEWFLGHNDLGMELYDAISGGCRDGLHVDRVNMNQGAESTLSFLLSLVEMQMAKNEVHAFVKP